jgi:prolyl 4-hydroxylase
MAPSKWRHQASLLMLLVATIAGGGLYYKDSIIGSLENVTFSNHRRMVVVERDNNAIQQDCDAPHDDDGTCDATKALSSPKEKGDSTMKHASNNKNDVHHHAVVVDDDDETHDKAAECADNHESCDMWASTGECEANPKYMLKQCQKSCMICGDMELDLGVEQVIDAKRGDEVRARIQQAKEYVEERIAKDPKQRYLLEGCKMNHKNCAYWGVLGECEANPGYMKLQCAPVCGTCEDLSIDNRCPLDLEKMTNAWGPGDLNEFFTNLTKLEKYKQYEPNVLSRPSYVQGDTEESATYKLGPWVVVLENVVRADEAEKLIELGAVEGYKRSSDVGKRKFDGTFESHVNDGRTSMNAWCQNKCYNDTTALAVIQRITDITNIPETNSENLQLLKYDVGQYYHTHHDYIPHLKERQAGVRLLTVFLYLNDVEEGGGTDFPGLGITVQPKRGRALIWPSVLDEAPDEKDPRTEHQALPVIKGIKYGANAWIHQRDFKTPNNNGCG